MANKTIQPDNRPAVQDDVNIASEALSACSLRAEENNRMSLSIVHGLYALNAELVKLDRALEMAYSA
jgi:hypothetical protein